MTDPIERVARAINSAPVREKASKHRGMRQLAEAAVNEYKAWLAEQGIPMEALLSGEMVAVPRDPDWSQGLARTRQCPGCGDLLVMRGERRDKIYCSDACRMKVYRKRKLAQADARLNADVVTPEKYLQKGLAIGHAIPMLDV